MGASAVGRALVLIALLVVPLGCGTADESGPVGSTIAPNPGPGPEPPLPPPLPPVPPVIGEGIGVLASRGDYEHLAAFGPRLSDGQLTKVTGAISKADNQSVFAVWAGDDGLPETAVITFTLVQFRNWRSSSVDLYVFNTKDDFVYAEQGVYVDPSVVSKLKAHASQGSIGSSKPAVEPASLPLAKATDSPPHASSALAAGKAFRIAGLVVGAASCALSVVGIPASLGSTALIAVATCGGFLAGVAAELIGNETLEGAALAMGAFTCAIPPHGGCVGVALSVMSDALEWSDDTRTEILGPNPDVPSPSTGLTVIVTPYAPQAFKNAIITAAIHPGRSGVSVTLALDGTDGYTQHETRSTSSDGTAVFTIPGGEPHVRDDFTVSGGGYTKSGSFAYR